MARAAAPQRPPLFLVATDGSAASEQALSLAIGKARAEGARLRVVTVVDVELLEAPSTADAAQLGSSEDVVEEARHVVAAACDEARAAGVDATAAVLRSVGRFDPAGAIVRDAERRRAKLVIVGSHGRTGIDRVMLGSVAERVVKLAHCPVLVVR